MNVISKNWIKVTFGVMRKSTMWEPQKILETHSYTRRKCLCV